MTTTRKTHGISFPNPEVLELAKERARRLDISLSKYINKLIYDDLVTRKPLILNEGEGNYQSDLSDRGSTAEERAKAIDEYHNTVPDSKSG